MQKTLYTIFVGFLFIPLISFAYTSPGKPSGYVNDFAHILAPADIQALNDKISALKSSTDAEVAVVTVPSLGGDETIETYAVKLFQEWGIGETGKDNGLLILVAPTEREARIEVGYGLEGTVTDLQSGNIITKVMIPSFKAGDYPGGIKGAVDAVVAIIVDSPEAAQYSEDSSSGRGSSDWNINFGAVIFFVIFILSGLARFLGRSKSWWLGGVMGAVIGAIIGLIWGFFYFGIIGVVVFTILGLIFDFLVSKGGPKGPFGPDGPGSIWFGPGMGGSSGSGGSGFGGFGGGMSGGGGASGRW